jgi:hypothetical protein
VGSRAGRNETQFASTEFVETLLVSPHDASQNERNIDTEGSQFFERAERMLYFASRPLELKS